MDISAKTTGVNEVQKEVRSYMLGTKQRISKAVRAGLGKILKLSKEYVPEDKGPLRRSGRVEKKRNETSGEVVYGDEVDVDYAMIQHEVPPPPEKSPGGKSFTHTPPETYKYLERAADELDAEVRQDVQDAVNGVEPPDEGD